jgi:serine phosphatase RsbU (regulator of sigma subunit)
VAQIQRLAAERHGWAPRKMVGSFLDDVQLFSGGRHQADDQTVMAIRRS